MDKVTESELKEVSLLLSNALSSKPALRTLSEQTINRMKCDQPDKLVLSLLYILVNQLETFELSSVLLKNLLSVMTANPENFIWTCLSREIQVFIKHSLLFCLTAPTTKAEVCRKVCNVIAELEGTLVDYDEEWPELLTALGSLLNCDTRYRIPSRNEAYKKVYGFQLLADVFPYLARIYAGNLKELLATFKTSLVSDPLPVKVACVKALCTVVLCLDGEVRETFEELVPLLAESIKKALIEDREEELKSFIIDITTLSDAAPRFLKGGFAALFQMAIVVAKTVLRNDEIPGLAIEMLVSAIERVPSLLLQGHMPQETGAYFSELFGAILHIMRYYTRNFDPTWIHPRDSFVPSLYSEDNDHLVLGQKAIDRLLGCTKRELGLSLLGPQILAYLERTEDWRCKYIAFLAASRIGPFIRTPMELSVFVPIVSNHAAYHSDPRIRFSAMKCLATLSEECDEVLHFYYHQEIMKALTAGLKDKVGRIQQEACIATRNFIEKMRQQQVDRYIVPLMENLEKLVDNSPPQIQEIAMAAIGTLAETTPETFRKYYYSLVMPSLIKVLEQFNDVKHKRFRGQTIECITIIAKAVGKELFHGYLPKVAKAMIDIQRTQLKSKDPQKPFLLASWQRICSLFSSDLTPYAHEIIPSILELTLSIPSVNRSPRLSVESVYEGETEEKEEAISLLGTLIEHLGSELDQYLDKFEGLLLGILQVPPNNVLKRSAARSLKGLVMSAAKGKHVESGSEAILGLSRKYIIELMKAIKVDTIIDNIEAEIEAIRDILLMLEGPCFTASEVVELFEEIMKLMGDSNSRAMVNIALKEQQTLGEQEIKSINEDCERENLLMIRLAQTIGGVMKSHPDESAGLIHVLYSDMLKDMLTHAALPSQTTFALTIIVAALKYLTYARIPSLYAEFTEWILKFALTTEPKSQAVSLEGLAAAVVGAGAYVETITDQCFDFILKALSTPMPEQVSRKEWRIAQEKAVISLSQIILSQKSVDTYRTTQMISLWIQHLPLRFDEVQGKAQIELLSEMILSNIEIVAGSNGENIKELLRVIIEVLDTEQVNQRVADKLLKGLRAMTEIKKWEDLITIFHGELPKNKQAKLKEYMHISTRVVS